MDLKIIEQTEGKVFTRVRCKTEVGACIVVSAGYLVSYFPAIWASTFSKDSIIRRNNTDIRYLFRVKKVHNASKTDN